MAAGNVPTTNVQALYSNSTPGTVISPTIFDSAIQDIVQTVNDNYAAFAGFYQSDKVTNLGILNVKDYGAKGDGVTDDTAAVQSAINAVTDGGVLVFPPSTYKISSTLYAGQTKSIEMVGSKGSILKASAAINMLIVGYPNNTDPITSYAKTTWVTIRGLYIDGNSIATNAVVLYRNGNTLLENCQFVNCTNDGVYGVWAENSFARNCNFAANTNNGIELVEYDSSHRSNQWLFDGCQFHNNGIGARLHQGEGATFDTCIFDDQVSYSIHATGQTNVYLEQCWFEEISATTMVDHIYLTGLGGHVTIDTCQFYGNLPSDAWINANTVDNGQIRNCFFWNNSITGLKITALSGNPYSKGWICESNENFTLDDPGYSTVIRGNPRVPSNNFTITQGIAYQNSYNAPITVYVPCWASAAGTDGTVTPHISPDNVTYTDIFLSMVAGATTSSKQFMLIFRVPVGWYFKITGSGTTNGNAIITVEQ